ncbi:MAG: deoxyribonuclease IV [Chloroflexota bacterium]
MPASGRLIGPHLQLSHGLLKAADRARDIGATSIQFFTDNPTAWRRRSAPPDQLANFRKRLKKAGVKAVAVHAPYLVNLCGSDEVFWQRSVDMMAHELSVARAYGAGFVVMHIGSHRGDERATGIDRLVKGLAAVLQSADKTNGADPSADPLPRLVLENSAGTGDGIGSSVEDLADILAAANAAGLPLDRLGVCLDTAHLWGAGYDVGGSTWLDFLSERIERLVGRANVVMLHLNDSRAELGSRLDRHEHIGAGKMAAEGLRDLLNHPWLGALPTFLETPGMDVGYDAVNLDRALTLAEGGVLGDLPAEAFTLRRPSRGRGRRRPETA